MRGFTKSVLPGLHDKLVVTLFPFSLSRLSILSPTPYQSELLCSALIPQDPLFGLFAIFLSSSIKLPFLLSRPKHDIPRKHVAFWYLTRTFVEVTDVFLASSLIISLFKDLCTPNLHLINWPIFRSSLN